MLASQSLRKDELTLQMRLSEPQYIEIRSDTEGYETRLGERNALVGQLSELRSKIIAAYELEDQEAQMAMARNIDPDGLTAEQREFHKLGQRTSIVEYMNAGFHQRALTPGTAEHEYNSHVFGSNWGLGEFPVEMFLDRAQYFSMEAHLAAQIFEQDMEQRTEVTGVVGTAGNLSFVDRIFANSEGAYCRAVYPAVGPGRHSYPIVTGVADVGAVIARGTGETVAGGLTVVNADPERIQHSFEVARADELQMPGIMSYLANDIRAGLMAGLDFKVIRDLETGLGAAVDLSGTTTITAGSFFGYVATAVDGIGARYFGEVRVLASNVANANADTSLICQGDLVHWGG